MVDSQGRPKRTRDVVRSLKKNGIPGVVLNKGPGYFCFDGSTTAGWVDHTVRVSFLADLTYVEWLAEYRRLERLAQTQPNA